MSPQSKFEKSKRGKGRELGAGSLRPTSSRTPSQLTEENLARHNGVIPELRLFRCQICPDRNYWYKRVPNHKPVHRCPSCKESWKAIPCDKEPVGYGHFRCSKCTNRWTSDKTLRLLPQPCHQCTQMGTRTMILCHLLVPEWIRKSPRLIDKTKPKYIHECPLCVGPPRLKPCPSFKKNTPVYSEYHVSTGSTASLDSTGTTTWLPQPDDVSVSSGIDTDSEPWSEI